MADYDLPRDAGRSDDLRGFGGREFAFVAASADQRSSDIDVEWPPSDLKPALRSIGVGGSALDAAGKLPKSARKAVKVAKVVNRFGAAYARYAGTETITQAMLDADRADRLADGRGRSPTPLAPRTIHRGEWIMLSREQYEGQDGRLKVFLEAHGIQEEGERAAWPCSACEAGACGCGRATRTPSTSTSPWVPGSMGSRSSSRTPTRRPARFARSMCGVARRGAAPCSARC